MKEEWDGWGKLGCVLGELIALPKEQSGRSGLGSITFLQTKHAHEHFELITHIIILVDTVSQTTSEKLDITGQIFLY